MKEARLKDLRSALRFLRTAATNKNVPVLSGVLMQRRGKVMSMITTDLETAAFVKISMPDDGADFTALPALRQVEAALKGLKEFPIIFHHDGVVRVGSAEMRSLPVEDFPDVRWGPGLFRNLEDDYIDKAGRVAVSASKDPARPILTTVYHRFAGPRLDLAATDSYRLAVSEVGAQGLNSVVQTALVPATAVKVVTKHLNGLSSMVLGEDEICYHSHDGHRAFKAKLIDGEFPNYSQLIPDLELYHRWANFDPENVIDVLTRAASVTGGGGPISLMFSSGGSVRLRASDPDRGSVQESLEGEWNGPDLVATYNPTYLADGFRSVGDEVVVYIRDELKPAYLMGDRARYLVMPVRIPR
jgi:DNA polymerase-3 subunit beta